MDVTLGGGGVGERECGEDARLSMVDMNMAEEHEHSSLLPLAWDCGCTVGPGAVGCPAGGGGAEDVLVVGFDSGVLEGYFLRAEEDAADRAAFDEEAPILRRLVCCSMKMIRVPILFAFSTALRK